MTISPTHPTPPLQPPRTSGLHRHRVGWPGLLLAALLAAGPLAAGDAPAHPAITASGVGAGLCVVVGAKPAADLAALTNGGRMLVECLVPTRAAADALRAEVDALGVSGLVTVKHQPAAEPLPYVEALVNLLVADTPPDPAEVRRVVAPLGSTVIAGRPARIPLPAGMDEWPQANRDAGQSNWSRDALVGPVMGFRWIAPQVSNRALDSVGGPQKVPLRLAGGRLFTFIAEPDAGSRRLVSSLECRDAFSGVRIWARPVDLPRQGMHAQFMIANADRLYTYPGRTEPLTCYDARSGEPLRTLPPPEPFPAIPPEPGGNVPHNDPRRAAHKTRIAANSRQLQCAQVIQAGDVLLVQRGNAITAYREADGLRLWQRLWPDVRVMSAAVSGNVLVVVQEPTAVDVGNDRYRGGGEGAAVGRILGLDLTTGADRWSRTDATDGCTGYTMQPPLIFEGRAVIVSKLVDYPSTGAKKPAGSNTNLP
ncbi:MAG: hypothetical protein RLZZ127_2243, partial [Planctomycetota bacterium]